MPRLRPAWILLALALTACTAPPAVGRWGRTGVHLGAAGLYSGSTRFAAEPSAPDREYDFESNGGLVLAYEANFDGHLSGVAATRFVDLDWDGPGGSSGSGSWLDVSAGLRWYLVDARERRAIEPFVALDLLALLRADVGDEVETAIGLSMGAGTLLWLHTDFALDVQARLLAARGAFTLADPDYSAWALEVAGSYWF